MLEIIKKDSIPGLINVRSSAQKAQGVNNVRNK